MEKTNIFLLHFAGGSSISYNFLLPYLHPYEVHVLELPGRGQRFREPIINNVEAAREDLLKQMEGKFIAGKSIIFGHSMGALLGFLVAHELEQRGMPARLLFLTGHVGIGLSTTARVHDFSPEAFKNELKLIGGVSDAFFRNEEVFDLFEPILRADFKLTYDISLMKNIHVTAPIYTIMGSGESDVVHIDNWGQYTTGKFAYEIMEGDHFFIYRNPGRISDIIARYAEN